MSSKPVPTVGDYLAHLASTPVTPDIQLLRDAAVRVMPVATPMPNNKSECWRYTSLRSLLGADLHAPSQATDAPEASANNEGDSHCIEMRDGFWRYPRTLPEGVHLAGMAALAGDKAAFQSMLDAQGSGHPFSTLNLASLNDVLVVSIDAGVHCNLPLLLRYASSATDLAQHALVVMRLGRGASCKLVEEDALDAGGYLNSRLWIQQDEDSSLQHKRVQCRNRAGWQMNILDVNLLAKAQYELVQASLGSELRRNDITVVLRGRGSRADLHGLYFSSERQQVDNHLHINHAEPGGQSDVCFHGLATDRAKAVFDGRIVIEQNADQTQAALQNRNLLLSNTAEINTKPALEIYASDVQCSHGATVGQLDEQALFYLLSRGIPLQQAELLLIQGFVSDILSRLSANDQKLWFDAFTLGTDTALP